VKTLNNNPIVPVKDIGIAKFISKNLVDVFINGDSSPTGFEESSWIRLQKRGSTWNQIKGIKILGFVFKNVVLLGIKLKV
jgi:hypothetical protein